MQEESKWGEKVSHQLKMVLTVCYISLLLSEFVSGDTSSLRVIYIQQFIIIIIIIIIRNMTD
jgi:hypothetical protein